MNPTNKTPDTNFDKAYKQAINDLTPEQAEKLLMVLLEAKKFRNK
jgi:hypothetical protein